MTKIKRMMYNLHPQQLLLFWDVDCAGFHWPKLGTSEHLDQHTDCNSCNRTDINSLTNCHQNPNYTIAFKEYRCLTRPYHC